MENENNTPGYQKNPVNFNSFYKYTREGIYRMEFKRPIPITLPADEQLKLFYKYCYLAECNDSMAKMYGYNTASEIIGKKLIEFYEDPGNPVNFETNRKFIEANYKIYDAETEESDKDSNVKFYSNNAIGIIEDGQLVGIWGTQIDITDRKKTELALRESEERYRLLVEHSPDGIAVHSNGIIVYVNESMINLLHCNNAEELLGKPVLSFVHPDYRNIVVERIKKKSNRKKAFRYT